MEVDESLACVEMRISILNWRARRVQEEKNALQERMNTQEEFYRSMRAQLNAMKVKKA